MGNQDNTANTISFEEISRALAEEINRKESMNSKEREEAEAEIQLKTYRLIAGALASRYEVIYYINIVPTHMYSTVPAMITHVSEQPDAAKIFLQPLRRISVNLSIRRMQRKFFVSWIKITFFIIWKKAVPFRLLTGRFLRTEASMSP